MRKQSSAPRKLASFAAATASLDNAHYVLQLYVVGTTGNSGRAIVNIRRVCEEHLQGRYDLEIVDISLRPELAVDHQIIAAPTLIKLLPLPTRRLIGNMSMVSNPFLGVEC
jgi:circadian clock protein KaiB